MARIVAAVDGSPVSRAVLRTAATLAKLLGADAEALHVGEPDSPDVERLAIEAGLPLRRLAGVPQEVIGRVLAGPDVQLGVLGARGAETGRRPAGRTALAVLQTVRRPIVVVPPDADGPLDGRLDCVLAPLDGSEASANAVAASLRMFCARGVDVVVLHVFEAATVPRFWDQAQHAQPVWEEEFRARYCDEVGVRVQLRSGVPGEHVLAVAAQDQADLIVLGWAQDLSAGRARTVRETLSGAAVPVLLVPLSGPGRDRGDSG